MNWHCPEHLQGADAGRREGGGGRYPGRGVQPAVGVAWCWPWMRGSFLVANLVCSHRFLARIPAMTIWMHVHNTDMNTHTHHHTGLAETTPGPWCPMSCGNEGMHTMLATGKKVCGVVGTLLVPRYPQGLNNRTETKFYTSKTTEYCRLSVVCPKCSLAQVFCSKTQ